MENHYRELLEACQKLMPKLCDGTVGELLENGTINSEDDAEFGSLATLGYLFRSPEAQKIRDILKAEGIRC